MVLEVEQQLLVGRQAQAAPQQVRGLRLVPEEQAAQAGLRGAALLGLEKRGQRQGGAPLARLHENAREGLSGMALHSLEFLFDSTIFGLSLAFPNDLMHWGKTRVAHNQGSVKHMLKLLLEL